MRISDWSSDVCSSDLHVEVDGTAPDAIAAHQGHERLVGPVEQGTEQEDRDAVETRELERHARGRLRGRLDGDDVVGHIDAEADRAQDVSGDPDVADGGSRSEEHTYELQSLMRISYAVFCLKKNST